jgi:hypothetical protein
MESDPAAQPLPSSADEPMMEVPLLRFQVVAIIYLTTKAQCFKDVRFGS